MRLVASCGFFAICILREWGIKTKKSFRYISNQSCYFYIFSVSSWKKFFILLFIWKERFKIQSKRFQESVWTSSKVLSPESACRVLKQLHKLYASNVKQADALTSLKGNLRYRIFVYAAKYSITEKQSSHSIAMEGTIVHGQFEFSISQFKMVEINKINLDFIGFSVLRWVFFPALCSTRRLNAHDFAIGILTSKIVSPYFGYEYDTNGWIVMAHCIVNLNFTEQKLLHNRICWGWMWIFCECWMHHDIQCSGMRSFQRFARKKKTAVGFSFFFFSFPLLIGGNTHREKVHKKTNQNHISQQEILSRTEKKIFTKRVKVYDTCIGQKNDFFKPRNQICSRTHTVPNWFVANYSAKSQRKNL